MSSMSVVDNIQLVDVNKKTHPQAILVKNNKTTNDHDINSSSSSDDLKEIARLSLEPVQDDHVVYSKFPENQIIDFEVGPLMAQEDDPSFKAHSSSKLDQLKHFSDIFIPILSFFKRLIPEFNISAIFNFSPFATVANKIVDIGNKIYQIGKKIVCDSIDIIKTVSKDVWNYSKELGKNIYSTVSNFFNGNSAVTPELQKNTNSSLKESTHVNRSKDKFFFKRISNQSVEQNRNTVQRPYWKRLDKISGPNPVVSAGRKFYKHFLSLRSTPRLDNNFLFEGEHSILQVNGRQISKYSPQVMLDDFKHAIPSLESRQLISSYAHQGIFSQPYIELFAEHPNLIKFKPQDSKFYYVVNEISDGVFQFVATSQADLKLAYETSNNNKYNAFGVQASMILSKDKFPEIKYSYFLR